MVDAGFRNGNGKIICSQQKLDEEAEKELNIYLEYLGRYKREYFLDDFHFYGWQVMSDSVEEPEAVKVNVDGEHHVHIEFNTKDHTPSPIMAALSFLFSKEMLYRHRGFLAPCPKGKANGGMRTYGCRDCESFICSMTCVSGGSSGVYCAYPAQANTYGDWDTDYRV